MSALELPPLALYVHIPWCVKKCPYCDFNSHPRPEELPESDYVSALLADLDAELDAVQGRSLASVFLGGGTPSLFSAKAIGRLLEGIRARCPLDAGAEITLEANPGTAEHDRFEGYLAAGVNRISLGAQSFHAERLRRLGRIHGPEDIASAVRMARRAGVTNLNLDLMYALPGQDLAGALEDLERALDLEPEHVSHYHLTLEPNTPFATRPPPDLPDEDLAWAMQEACQERLAEHGYHQYEISAFARPGRRSHHNLNYWQFGDYLGIGAGAHGKITHPAADRIVRRAKQRSPRRYLAAQAPAERIAGEHAVPRAERPLEFMLNALRLIDGVPRASFTARTGLTLEGVSGYHRARARGLLADDGTTLRPTALGARFLNDLIGLFDRPD